MKKTVFMSLMASSIIMAGGYKIPETSTNSVALGGANIAHTKNADAAYDNPANMVFMDDAQHAEVDLMYVGLSSTNFKGTYAKTLTGAEELNSEKQTFILPSLHYVSPKLGENGVRVGLSITVPAGLSRQWEEGSAKLVSQEFTLKIVEVSPSVAYKITNTLALAFGFRAVHTSGVVKSSESAIVNASPLATSYISRDLEGSSLDFGYNLALAYHPTKALELAATYRSNVNLTVEGSARLSSTAALGGAIPAGSYNGEASVSIPLPATLMLAGAYTFEKTKTTVEVVYEKAYWSAYKSLDFEYDGSLTNPVLIAAFDNPKPKNWKDTNTFRLGITQELDKVTLRAGAIYDETPTPESTLNFESPGSNAYSFSFGGRYQINDSMDIGLSALYSIKKDRTISGTTNINGLDGTFSNSRALLVSAGLGYKF
ncbi:outer membrane protein transport protein [Sulfurimonas sp. NW7]|uniref:OmpP1/FadL family transporter n=1 Tax=Sulfurimonas sp. NW7 TaxID=2922727 RepID=UPI003DA878F3